MKVAYFLGGLNRGGMESLVLDVCRQHGHTPYDFVCIYRHDGNMSEAFKASGVPLINIPKTFGYMRYLWAIRKALLREHVTIVHSQTPSNTLLLAVALIGTGIKILTTFHGYNFSKASYWQRKIVYSASEKILCVSQHQKSWYEMKWQLPKENKLQVVYNGIDFQKIENCKLEIEDLELKNEGGIRLCMVGNFVDVRSQIVIVKGIECLKERGITNFDFFFVGKRVEQEGNLYDACVQYCKDYHLDNIHFLGSRGDVPALLHSMNGFVYSSARDTFGIALIEAIASSLPVVVNDWPVMNEVCNIGLDENNKAIRFFKTEDVEDCASQMEKLITDIRNHKEELQHDCALAGEACKQEYSIEKHIERLSAVYSVMCKV